MSVDIKTAKLGQEFSHKELKQQCKAIYGAVAWPGKRPEFVYSRAGHTGGPAPGLIRSRAARPGFAVVVAMDRDKHFDSYDVYLLDEFESMDIRELVRQCGALDYKYKPKLWIGDRSNDAADRLIREMNKEMELPRGPSPYPNFVFTSKEQRKPFYICSTPLLDMKNLYQYIFTEIKRLLDPERRQLFLKDSRIRNHLSVIEPSEIANFTIGEYPSVEALAFAVIELRERERDSEPYEDDMSIAKSYAVKSCF